MPSCSKESIYDACDDYEKTIECCGGIDLQLLGIGSNGHIGFNEPSSSFSSATRPVALAQSTISDNSTVLESGGAPPNMAITMGIGTILKAKRIVILATGIEKSKAVASALEGALSISCPASSLQLHPNVTWMIDKAAASKLKNTEYYSLSQQLLYAAL